MRPAPRQFDVIVLGAGAAGLMCAAVAGQRGRRVALLEHNGQPGRKILISGGGRCNFTNLHCEPGNFLSENPHFAKSALALYQPRHFIELVERYGIRVAREGIGTTVLRQVGAGDRGHAAGGMRAGRRGGCRQCARDCG